ncbi:MAG: PEP-CTERM sorting domain-containing protein [Desulfobulbus sp.]|jgi:hypothetical protein
MKTTTQIGLIAAATLLLSSTAMALPSAGDSVTFLDKKGTTTGGEFYIDTNGDQQYDYISFCAEKDEYITMGQTYTIDSVTDYAVAGGNGAVDGKDYLSAATKWVMANYILNQGIFYEETRTVGMINDVQNIIWALEEEISGYASQRYLDVLAQEDYSFEGSVWVLNLNTAAGGLAQSQIIYEPVPEPTTMLLFGAGMLGLAAVARRREQ